MLKPAATVLAVALFVSGTALAQTLEPSSDDLRLEAALDHYCRGEHDTALRILAGFSRGQVMEAPKTFQRTITGQRLLREGSDAASLRLGLGLMFVEAGLEAFVRAEEDLSGAFLAIAHVWLTRHLDALPSIGNPLMVPAAMARDVCVVAVGPLLGRLQLDAARKAWKLCPPQVRALAHVMVLRGSIEEVAASERMDRAAHFYAPGASYGPGGVPVARELAIDRLNVNIADATARMRGRRHRLLRWREAEGWYARALAEAAGNDMARLRLAYVRSQLDEERDAALGFPWLVNPANRVAPGVRYLAHLFSARAAEEEGTASLARAIAHYEQAIRIMPKSQAAYIGLSLLRFDSDRAEAARLVRQAVTRPTDELVDPWFNYDMQFAFEAAILRERRYLEVRAGASSRGESQ